MVPVSMAAKSSSTNEDENNQSSSSRKTSSTKPHEQALKCPRCDSQNTKFCYYNNYNLTQPRHFCKTCRRYWTKGGALRSVPIGGGCRKNKKSKLPSRLTINSKDTNMSSDIGGVKFFHGLTPTMDFQLGGLNSFPRVLNNHSSPTGLFTQFCPFGDISISTTTSGAIASSPCFNLDPSGSSAGSLMGFNFPFSSVIKPAGDQGTSLGFTTTTSNIGDDVHISLASSIESLSSINQDLHLKLQQQRLAMLEQNEREIIISSTVDPSVCLENKPQTILFHNLETSNANTNDCGVDNNSRKERINGSNLSTEWLFGSNTYAPGTPTNSSSNGGNDQNHMNNNWNGMNQAWSNLSQYSGL